MKRIHVDRSRCSGIGICESVAPDVFEIGDDGTLNLLTELVEPNDAVEVAVQSCPAAALSLVADEAPGDHQ